MPPFGEGTGYLLVAELFVLSVIFVDKFPGEADRTDEWERNFYCFTVA
jgi:hypothetical protein